MPSSKRSPSKKSGSKSKKSTKYIAPKKKAPKKSKKASKKHSSRSYSSRGGISQDAMVLMALTQHQNQGQPLDAIIPWLLLTDNNSLKTNLVPLVVYHLQSNGGAGGNCMLLPYLLAFMNKTLSQDELLLYMTQMKDQYGQPMLGNGMGLGGGFGGNNNNALALAMIGGGGRLDARSLLLVQYLQGNHGFTNEQAIAQLQQLAQSDPAAFTALAARITGANAAQIAQQVANQAQVQQPPAGGGGGGGGNAQVPPPRLAQETWAQYGRRWGFATMGLAMRVAGIQ